MDYGIYPEIKSADIEICQQLEVCFDINNNKKIELKKGDIIDGNNYRDKFIFLYKGKFSLSIINELGTERILWFIDAKNILFNAPKNEIFYHVLQARTNCILYVCSQEALFSFIGGNTAIINYMLESGRRRGVITGDRVHSITTESSKCRVYKFIYQLATTYGNSTDETFYTVSKLPIQNEIASLLGVHRTNVTKYISYLESENIMIKRSHSYEINLKELKSLIDNELLKT